MTKVKCDICGEDSIEIFCINRDEEGYCVLDEISLFGIDDAYSGGAECNFFEEEG